LSTRAAPGGWFDDDGSYHFTIRASLEYSSLDFTWRLGRAVGRWWVVFGALEARVEVTGAASVEILARHIETHVRRLIASSHGGTGA